MDKAVAKKKEKKRRDKSGVTGLHATEVEKTNDQSTPPPPSPTPTPTPLRSTKTPVGKKGK